MYRFKDNKLQFQNPQTKRWLNLYNATTVKGYKKKSSSYYRLVKNNQIPKYEDYVNTSASKIQSAFKNYLNKREKKKQYVINVKFNVVEGEKQEVRAKQLTTNKFLLPHIITNKSLIEKIIKKLINEWISEQKTHHKQDYTIEFQNIIYFKVLPFQDIPLKKIKNKKIKLFYDMLDKEFQRVNFGENDICVLDYIYMELKGKEKFETLTIEKLKKEFVDYQNGISVEEVIQWAKSKKYISVYAVSPFMKVFENYVSETPKYALVFIVNNNHVYGVFNKEYREQIFKSKEIKLSAFKFMIDYNDDYDVVSDYNDIFTCKKHLVLVNSEIILMNEIINEIVKEHETIVENISFNSNNDIAAFEHPITKQIYIYSPKYYERKNIMGTLYEKMPIEELRFKNQSFQEIAKCILKYFFNKEPIMSEYNDKVLEVIDTYKPKPRMYKLSDDGDVKNAYAFDIKKSYSSFLKNNTYDYPIFTVCDEVKEYNGSDDIVVGMYYIDKTFYLTSDKAIFLEKGFYTHMIIDRALKRGNITKSDIKFVIKAGHYHKSDYFKELVDFTYNNFDSSLSKLIINAYTGFLGTRYNSENYAAITDSWETTLGCINEETNKKRECKSIFLNDYYFIQSKKKTRKLNDYVPFYQMIIEGGIINLMNLHDNIFDKTLSKVTYVKVDCIGIKNPKIEAVEKAKEESDVIGSYRLEKYQIKGTYPIYDKNPDFEYNTDDDEWTKFEENANYDDFIHQLIDLESFFIQADGGAGKSYTVVQLMKTLNDKTFKFMCFTNKAAVELKHKGATDVCTIDSLFYDEFKKVNSLEFVINKLKDIDYLVIDEYSMIPLRFISKFLRIKSRLPKLNFIIIGDNKQLKPINGDKKKVYDYKDNYAFRFLCNFNYIEMRYKPEVGRYDENTYKILCDLNETNTIPECLSDRVIKDGLMTNICYYKNTSDNVNKKCGELFNKENPNAKKINEDFYVGMKVISNTNFKKQQVFNSEIYYIEDFNNDKVYIKNDINTAEFKKDTFINNFSLGYCITTYRMQGTTINEEYNIYDVNSMSKELIYVALSRCRNINNVYFDYTDTTFREEGFRDDAKELDGYIHFEDNYNNGKIYGIYEDDKLIYIGQTVRDINKRFREHMEESETLKDKLHIYLKENGDKNFSIRLIKNHPCTSKYELDAEEQRQIKKYKDEVVLYNTCYNTIKTNNSRVEKDEVNNRLQELINSNRDIFRYENNTKDKRVFLVYKENNKLKKISKRYNNITYEEAKEFLENKKQEILKELNLI